ncbi:MAG: hypothetical protein FD123_4251 [Bacteroidetes bacterium]|nr:MAG: hypothetical protein FD123_4251 [Bacteroidota bacterium]
MWWFLLILLVLILSVIFYLLLAPFFIIIDTNTGLFQFRFHRLADFRLVLNENEMMLYMRIAWWKKESDLLNPGERKKRLPAPVKTKKRKRRKPVPFRKIMRMVIAVIRSFRVKQCYISIDTGNMPLNGILYPWFFLLSRRTGQNIMINFRGEETIVLRLQNSLGRIAWAMIKSKWET